jgi:hypothetical protein
MRLGFLAIVLLIAPPAMAQANTDARDRQKMIQESISAYSGSCPCPYNSDRAGRSCGARSAHSRPGGASPLCYPRDVSDAMLAAWRAQRR